jgi:hypothetical protein
MWLVYERREVHTGVWWGNLGKRGIDGMIILNWILKKFDGRVCLD